ncbi:MAG: VanZ family protein [Eubacterium sp.]
MTKTNRRVRFWGRVLFIVYMILALYFMFFSETLDRTMVNDEYRYNLTLFKEITRFWEMRHTYGWGVTIVNLLGNIVCFMPFGFLLPTVSRKKVFKNVISVTLFAMLFSVLIETAQLVTKVGAFDVDDIFLNTIGGLSGYILMKLTRVRKHI